MVSSSSASSSNEDGDKEEEEAVAMRSSEVVHSDLNQFISNLSSELCSNATGE